MKEDKLLSSEKIIVSPEFFKEKGDVVEYPLPQDLIDASTIKDGGAMWAHAFDKNYERFLPETLVNAIKLGGYFAFALISKTGESLWVTVYISSEQNVPFVLTSEISGFDGEGWHTMDCDYSEAEGAISNVQYCDEGIIEFDGEQITNKDFVCFYYDQDGEKFDVDEDSQVLFDILELNLRRLADEKLLST